MTTQVHSQTRGITASQSQSTISRFWVRWLIGISLFGILFGLMFAFVPDVFQNTLGGFYYNSGAESDLFAELTDHAMNYLNFTYGVTGSVMAGWIAMFLMIVIGPFSRGERWAWNALAVSLLVWFIPDTLISLMRGIPANAVLNMDFVIGFGLPLVATYRQFHPAR